MSLKVCILSPKMPWPPRDGGAIAVLSLATGLADVGAQVTLLACNTQKHYYPVSKLPEELTSKIKVRATDVDTRVKPLAALANLLFSRKAYVAQRFESTAFARDLAGLLNEGSFDIVQLESPYMGAYINIIRKHSAATIVLRTHNIENEIWKRRAKQSKNPLLKWYFSSLARRIKAMEIRKAQEADALVPISKRDGDYFNQMAGKRKQLVCPVGIEHLPADNGNNEGGGMFYIGALDWGPNQEGLRWFISKVWPLLNSHETCKLAIAGRNAPRWLIQLLNRKGIDYHGEVADARTFMNNYQVMLVPLLSGSGLRVKIIEAMALGKCVVTTGIGAEGIDAQHGKELLIADQADDFARICKNLCADPAHAKEIGEKARAFANRHYTNNKTSEKLYRFYEQLIRQ